MVVSNVDPWDLQPQTQKGLGTKRFPVELPSTHTLAGLEEEYDGGKKELYPHSFAPATSF